LTYPSAPLPDNGFESSTITYFVRLTGNDVLRYGFPGDIRITFNPYQLHNELGTESNTLQVELVRGQVLDAIKNGLEALVQEFLALDEIGLASVEITHTATKMEPPNDYS
jgi:hypothetical protein